MILVIIILSIICSISITAADKSAKPKRTELKQQHKHPPIKPIYSGGKLGALPSIQIQLARMKKLKKKITISIPAKNSPSSPRPCTPFIEDPEALFGISDLELAEMQKSVTPEE